MKSQDLPASSADGGIRATVAIEREIEVERIYIAGPNYDTDLDMTLGDFPLGGPVNN